MRCIAANNQGAESIIKLDGLFSSAFSMIDRTYLFLHQLERKAARAVLSLNLADAFTYAVSGNRFAGKDFYHFIVVYQNSARQVAHVQSLGQTI